MTGSRGEVWRRRAHVLLAALVLTIANAGKPLVVDDTAYTYYARQIAAEPTDPYGFEIFWYQTAQPAFQVLAPPVLPYWLAGSMLLLGDDPQYWKLALFPFALALAASLHALLARFAASLATPCLWMGVLSPPVLAFLNLMLDVPATSLALLVVALFLAACDRGSFAGAVVSGLVAGLAMQTKYTGATALAAVIVYGAVFARIPLALVTTAIGACVFAGWETLMALRYGSSHFVLSLLVLWPQRLGISLESATLWTAGFTILVGALAAPLGLLGLAALRVPQRLVGLAASAVALCFAWIPFLPQDQTFKMQSWPQLADASPEQPFFLLLGIGTVASVAAVAWRLGIRREREDLFLVAWLAIEIAAFAVLSPLLAARRILGVSLVGLLVCARELSRGSRSVPGSARMPVAAGIALGVLFAASDFTDALAIRDSVRVAERELRALGADTERETVWFIGHWGFQFYAERAGMRPVVPGVSQLRRGDWIVAPDGIDAQRLRGGGGIVLPQTRADLRTALPWSTHPWAYGGTIPMRRRQETALRLWIYRVKEDVAPAL